MPLQDQPRVTLTLFAAFDSTLDGHPNPFLRSKKNRALFAYLVLARSQPVLRSTLATLLWPDYTENSARTNLRQALVRLRNIFAPLELLQADYEQVQLIVDDAHLTCDVLHFDNLLAACEIHRHSSLAHCPLCQERLRQAAALYKGPFLDQFPDLDSPPFEEWRQRQQEQYAERFAEIQATLEASMRPISGLGDAARPPDNLPATPAPLMGRADEVEELITLLLQSTYRSLTLTGIGGTGKTRLALAVGEALRSHFADGTWWVDLSALVPSTFSSTSPNAKDTATDRSQLHDQIATTISTAIGLSRPGTLRPTQHLINHLRERTSLLILDNYEQISAGAGLVAELLNAAPNLWLLITSRHRLPLQYQQIYPVEGLTCPTDEIADLPPAEDLLSRYASLQLFVECARRADFALPLDPINLGALVAICRLVEGLPLAIELAAALLETQPPSTILETLRRTYGALQVQVYDMPARQQSMRSVLVAAWELLSPSEAQTLARCAIFRGGFTVDAAQHIADATSADLEGLIHKSLLRRTVSRMALKPRIKPEIEPGHDPQLIADPQPQYMGVRYTVHELVRQFAAEQLAQQAVVAKQTGDRHATYYMTLLAGWRPEDEAERRFRAAIQLEIENVESAWDWALAADQITLLLPAIDGLVEFYEMEGRYSAAEVILRRSVVQVRARLSAPTTTSYEALLSFTTLLATLLVKLGHVYTIGLAQLQQADEVANEALALAEDVGDIKLTVQSYCVLATNAYGENEYAHARKLAEKALHLAQTHKLEREIMIALSTLGLTLSDLHNQGLSLHYLHQALAMAQQANDTRKTLFYRNQLGGAYRDFGDFSAALRYFEENLPATRQNDDPSQLAFALANLGFLMLLMGDYTPAREYLEDGYQHFIVLGEKRAASDSLALIGQLLLQQSRYADAITYCQRALALAKQNVLITAQQMAWLTLGDLYREEGKWVDAEAAYTQTIAACTQPNAANILLLAQCGQAALLLGENKPSAALVALETLLPKFNPNDFDVYFSAQRFLLPAYQILTANQDPRAAHILQQAWQIILDYAEKISEPRLHQSYLSNISLHRTIGALVEQNGLALCRI